MCGWLQVESELFKATRASLLAVFAAHALLMAFALKLRMSAALRQQEAKAAAGGLMGWWAGVLGVQVQMGSRWM